MRTACDRFGRTPETVADRHDQGLALSLVHHSLSRIDVQRVTRGFIGRRKARRIRAAWARAEQKSAVFPEKTGGEIEDDSVVVEIERAASGGGDGDPVMVAKDENQEGQAKMVGD